MMQKRSHRADDATVASYSAQVLAKMDSATAMAKGLPRVWDGSEGRCLTITMIPLESPPSADCAAVDTKQSPSFPALKSDHLHELMGSVLSSDAMDSVTFVTDVRHSPKTNTMQFQVFCNGGNTAWSVGQHLQSYFGPRPL